MAASKEEKVDKKIVFIIEKAEKYIRQNSDAYFGDDRYVMKMSDYLYFVEGACNEIRYYIEHIKHITP